MEKDTLRSFPWDRSPLESSASNDLNNAPRITSALWKSLSEEGIDISMPSFTNPSCFTPNDFSPSEQFVPNNSQSPSPPLDFWGEGLRTSSPVVGSKLKQKDQWETWLTPQTSDLFGLSSLSSNPPFGTSDSFPNIGNENLYQDFYNGLGGNKSNTGPLLSDQQEATHFKQPYPYSSLASNIWDIDIKPNFTSQLPPTSVNGSDAGLSGLSTASLSQLVSKLQQRKALRDIGNLSQSTYSKNAYDPPNFCAPLKREVDSSQKSSTPYSGSQYDIYNSTETLGTQPQRQQTDLVALMQELSVLCEAKGASKDMVNGNVQLAVGVNVAQSPIPQSSTSPTSTTKCCVFCKNNNYHSTFYKSHNLKDERGHCQCPVLRMYVCPLCSATGDSAHTLKYCPRNTVTRGDPISAGLPPGKVTNWREVAHRMIGRFNTN